MNLRRWIWATVFLFSILISRRARADELTVEVRPAAAALDTEALRRGIADELRDSGASGRIVVDVEANELVVTYGKLTRRVPMPADAAEARTTAIALAGNLARDEAAELAAALKKKPSPPPFVPVAKPPEPEPFTEMTSLRATLAQHAARERRYRLALGTTITILGAGSITAGAIMSRHDDLNVTSAYSISVGTILLVDGVLSLLAWSPYERLAADSNATEADWIREAENERSWRTTSGIINLVGAGALLGVGTLVVADRDLNMSDSARQSTAAFAFGVGAAGAIVGVWRLATPGPLEAGLHDWQTAVRPSVAVLPGGAMASVSISF